MVPVAVLIRHGRLAHELGLAADEDDPKPVEGEHGQAQDEEGRTGSSHGRRPEAQQAQGGPQEPGPDEEDAPAGGGGGTLPHFLGQGAKGVLHLTGDLGALEDQDEKKNEIDDQEEHG